MQSSRLTDLAGHGFVVKRERRTCGRSVRRALTARNAPFDVHVCRTPRATRQRPVHKSAHRLQARQGRSRAWSTPSSTIRTHVSHRFDKYSAASSAHPRRQGHEAGERSLRLRFTDKPATHASAHIPVGRSSHVERSPARAARWRAARAAPPLHRREASTHSAPEFGRGRKVPSTACHARRSSKTSTTSRVRQGRL